MAFLIFLINLILFYSASTWFLQIFEVQNDFLIYSRFRSEATVCSLREAQTKTFTRTFRAVFVVPDRASPVENSCL